MVTFWHGKGQPKTRPETATKDKHPTPSLIFQLLGQELLGVLPTEITIGISAWFLGHTRVNHHMRSQGHIYLLLLLGLAHGNILNLNEKETVKG
jgi:hypothetical protein